jgi:hypothetical protein
MTRQVGRRMVWTLCGALAFAGVTVAAQGVLAQLGVAEAEARQYILDNISSGSVGEGTLGHAAKVSYAKIAPSGRAAATTAFYAWTKAYVNSPAFKTAYAKMRTEQKPEYTAPTTTPEQEAQTTVNAQVKQSEDMVKVMLPSIPEADRPKAQAQMKAQLDLLKSPESMKSLRSGIADKRAKDKADYDMLMTEWNATFPADPNVRIAVILREFLANTTDVDFAAKTRKAVGEAGEFVEFVNEAYNKKPWQWQLAFDFGPEVLAAARASASAWVKELPAK